MKIDPPPTTATAVTLQTVLDRLAGHPGLNSSRRRDLRSAVTSFAKLVDQPPAAVPLDLAEIRQSLDRIVPARAKISAKRWANIRSDLAAAIDASGLQPMLGTAKLKRDDAWERLMAGTERHLAISLSRFARWASLRRIAPEAIDDKAIECFVTEMRASTLLRNVRYLHRYVAKRWNKLVAAHPTLELKRVTFEGSGRNLKRLAWQRLPASFRDETERYICWASMPDPLAEAARARALSPRTLRLQQQHLHSAVSAALAAGIPIEELTTLASLVELETFRALLRQRWQQDGRKLTAYTHGMAITLIAIASEWVKAPPQTVATLKALRKKLGALPSGLTEKNKALLRTLDDPRLLIALLQLPDRMWHAARRTKSHRSFVDLQTALAIDILIHAPVRMQNLSTLQFDVHLHWPQGRRKPALITLGPHETKNKAEHNAELPAALADRLQLYRTEIAPAMIGRTPDTIFLTKAGKTRAQSAIANAIFKAILRHLGFKMTPHQFRHLCAKITLDDNPGAYELLRQKLGHASQKTTTAFYAGIDTLRAGRAHAELVTRLRETNLGRRRRRRPAQADED
jgi:integrase